MGHGVGEMGNEREKATKAGAVERRGDRAASVASTTSWTNGLVKGSMPMPAKASANPQAPTCLVYQRTHPLLPRRTNFLIVQELARL